MLNCSSYCSTNFNSIKVRLKLLADVPATPATTYFNSIKVRLKQTPISYICINVRFQFHKGTIKTCICLKRIVTWWEFQFHKGTIKTLKQAAEGSGDGVFQFHKGTIKTLDYWLNQKVQKYFNSIKVRLKRQNRLHEQLCQIISIP